MILSLETFWHPQVGNWKRLCKYKLQLIIPLIMTKFLMEKRKRFHFCNFLTRYEVQPYSENIIFTNEFDWWCHQLDYVLYLKMNPGL